MNVYKCTTHTRQVANIFSVHICMLSAVSSINAYLPGEWRLRATFPAPFLCHYGMHFTFCSSIFFAKFVTNFLSICSILSG